MALALGHATVPIQAISCSYGCSKSLGFKSSRVALPPVKLSAKLANWSKQAGSGDDLSPDEDLEMSSRLVRISFPSHYFLFGAATAPFQVEGSAFGGREECIWTTFCRNLYEIVQNYLG